ncbi:MAG TPA: LutB/LldF family L-lactate oxidation iron-sulfur protein, partial [Burkholderiales bacterium]|nr:LutB/LldF family L-lactate oxidation iron-sulfur protein [Burkholderiales bacterium]
NLDSYLQRFEKSAQAAGAIVHWAETPEEACRIVAGIARQHNVRKIVKSKSMVTEECALNDHLEGEGLEVVETDLGEYILQLAKEPPSHIVAPVMHMNKDEIATLFEEKHRLPRQTEIPAIVDEARVMLRKHFLSADMGISGGNFLIAETGSVMLFTNEGNGRLSTTLPRVHVAITGIEKVVPTLEDAANFARLLPRSATGQPITNYISLLTGKRRSGDLDGPEHMHIVLLDNGRSGMLGTVFESMLRCIRCGACMNHCPVYQNVGGHAYGWVYPGPMGAVLTPLYAGMENTVHLPNASTFCGKCAEVCPVKIPLPDLMRELRAQQFDRRLRSWQERWILCAWRWIAERPALYAFGTRVGIRLLSWLGGRKKRLRWLPGGAWTRGRDMPAPSGRTFRDLYRERRQ